MLFAWLGGASLAKSNMMWGGLVSRDCHPIKITHSHVLARIKHTFCQEWDSFSETIPCIFITQTLHRKGFLFSTTQAEVWDNLWKCGGICELWCEKRRNNGDNGTLGSRLLGNTHVGPNLALGRRKILADNAPKVIVARSRSARLHSRVCTSSAPLVPSLKGSGEWKV